MTDIEKLKDAVIEAAREVDRCCSHTGTCPHCRALESVLRALDAALKPDPWKLLAEARDELSRVNHLYSDSKKRIDAALAWREANPDA